MKMEFLESFKKFLFNSGTPEPVSQSPDYKDIKEEAGVDSFDPYYEEMCVNKYHLDFCKDVKVADINKIVYCKDCKHFLGEQCSLALEDSTKTMVRKIIDSKITKPELIRFHNIIIEILMKRKSKDNVFKMVIDSAKDKLSFDEHLSICLFYLIARLSPGYSSSLCYLDFNFLCHSAYHIDDINKIFKFYRTLDREFVDESKKVVGRVIDEIPTIEYDIKKNRRYPRDKDHLMLNCINKCPFFMESPFQVVGKQTIDDE